MTYMSYCVCVCMYARQFTLSRNFTKCPVPLMRKNALSNSPLHLNELVKTMP